MIKEKLQNIKSSPQANLENQGSDNMKQGWEIKKLGEVCKVIAGQSPEGKFYNSKGIGMPFYQGKKEFSEKYIGEPTTWTTKITKEAEAGDVLMSVRAPVGPVNFSTQKICIGRGLAAIRAGKNIDKEFLYNFLIKHENEIEGNAGAVFNSINKTQIEAIAIPLPPLPEQQRIVSILDKAFAAIDKAKANAEQNLKNAKELFESYLQEVFDKKGDGWEIKTLGEVSKINYGYTEKASFDEVGPKFLRITDIQENGVDWDTVPYCKCSDKDLPKYKLEKGDIVFARTGATTGKSYLIDNPPISVFASYLIRLRMNSINEFIPEFIYYFFQTKTYWDKINAGISGSAQGGFNATKLGELEFHFPKSKTEQQTIVRQLDALRAETQKLEGLYQKKIDNLEELKKSILQKAFNGELSSSVSASASVGKVIPLRKVNGISATDLQAGITAFALKKHIDKNQQHSFHHVKAEKIVHLSEYILNIDLERNPVKDAAGPNDFPRAKKVESRARKAGFYYVFKNGESYDYQIGRNINSVIQNTLNSLGEKADTLSQIIDLLIPINTQQAEIVATVYAAWNNLLLRGVPFSDEDIVTEARENWHPAKKNFSKDRFFNAIEWIRKNELLIPKGNGKLISKK